MQRFQKFIWEAYFFYSGALCAKSNPTIPSLCTVAGNRVRGVTGPNWEHLLFYMEVFQAFHIINQKNQMSFTSQWNLIIHGGLNEFQDLQPTFFQAEFVYPLSYQPFYAPYDCQDFLRTELPNECQQALPNEPKPASKQEAMAPSQTSNKSAKKGNKQEEKGNSKANKNIKTNIFKDFVKSIRKDASGILIAKQVIKSEYSIKKFMDFMSLRLPEEGKYIRFKVVQDLCNEKEDPQFSRLFRTVLRNFLSTDYQLTILTKKKTKVQYLRATRDMLDKMVRTAGWGQHLDE